MSSGEITPILVVIPARGGSKTIPRKNLRPLCGKPLLSYVVRAAQGSAYRPTVSVSSDDREILELARSLGAEAVERPSELAGDSVTLDPVVYHAYTVMRERRRHDFGVVVTMQPTSPLLRSSTLDGALAAMEQRRDIDTIISARPDPHLSWRLYGGRFVPNYRERLNRQELEPEYRETGGFMISRSRCITPASRIGEHVSLHILNGAEAIDIDDYEQWALCEYHLRRRRILFVVAGHEEIGLGHVYNCLLLANEMVNHEVLFLVDRRSAMAFERIATTNFPVLMQQHENIVDDIAAVRPDVVINDCLDTRIEYVRALKQAGYKVVNLEDLGEGAKAADLVINAMYPEQEFHENHFYGAAYFPLRDEFLRVPPKEVADSVREVLITFGGTDPNNYTRRVLEEIAQYCRERRIHITVVAGFGYSKYESLKDIGDGEVLHNVSNIAELMHRADVVFTSAGRTAYEVASVGTPAIVLAQNQRELTHFFASAEHGFLNLGLGEHQPPGAILRAFRGIVEDPAARRQMNRLMRAVDLRSGKRNVMRLLSQVLGEAGE